MVHTVGTTANTYYFQRNLQGDVVAIYDTNGTLKAKYLYDAWGNCTISGETTSYDVANANPIRYRGYYYDDDTGLYYCNARYYSPKWHRFISPDDTAYLDPESVNGLNLYCYCNNDPVNCVDIFGHSPIGMFAQFFVSFWSYIGMGIMSIWDEDIRADMNAIGWNPFNDNETIALNSRKVSFYKGVPIYKFNHKRSGSFCAIFLNSSATETTLKHEYGHNVQQRAMGPVKFGLMIGLPSWQEWSSRPYFKRPWEITADVLGGVTRDIHTQEDIIRGFGYLTVSTLFGPFGYFFLFGEY